jgi:O-antigen/teichoic acid export membrane protein
LNLLGIEDFGLYNLVGGFTSLLSMLTFSISGCSQRFLTFELGTGNEQKLADVFVTIKRILYVFSVCFFCVSLLIGIYAINNIFNIAPNKLHIACVVYVCSLLLSVVQIIAAPYTSLVVAHERMSFYAGMSIIESTLRLGLILTLYAFGSDSRLVAYAFIILFVGILVRVVYGVYVSRNFKEVKRKAKFDRQIFKSLLSFSFWTSFGTSSGLLKDHGISILINLFFGLTLNAAIGIMNQVKGLIYNISSNLNLAISPQITKSFSSGNCDKSVELTFMLAKYQSILMSLVIIPIFFNCEYLLNLWLGDVPEYTPIFVKLICILQWLMAITQSNTPLFLAIGKIRNFQTIISVITLIIVPISYLFYRGGFPPQSYIYVCIGVEAVIMLMFYIFLKKEINFPICKFFVKVACRALLVIIATACVYIVMELKLDNETFSAFLIKSVVGTIVFALLIYCVMLDLSEKIYIKNMVMKYFRRNTNL